MTGADRSIISGNNGYVPTHILPLKRAAEWVVGGEGALLGFAVIGMGQSGGRSFSSSSSCIKTRFCTFLIAKNRMKSVELDCERVRI